MSHTLRFCSWNIQVGIKRAHIMEIVAQHSDFRNVDVIALQEASAHAQGDDASSIAGVLGATYTSYHHVYNHLKTRPQANALVWNTTRVHFHAIEHHTLPNHSQAVVPRAERAVLNRLKGQARVNLVGDGGYNENFSLRVCTAHLDVLGYRFKRQQFRAVLDDLRARSQVDVLILAGDFNTFRIGGKPTWAQLKRDAAELGLRAISDDIKWTQAVRALRLRQKLDEIFVSTTRACHSRVWTLDVQGSDHVPIFAEITIE
jgi:endonuclease/exonuclease/phosphatase family metal-dependent hydrolase